MKWLPNVFGQGICHYSHVSYTMFGVIIIQLFGRVSAVKPIVYETDFTHP